MKRDLYLIAEAYKNKPQEGDWLLILKLRNIGGVDDYYTFKPFKDKTDKDEEVLNKLTLMRSQNKNVRSASKIISDKSSVMSSMLAAHIGPKKDLEDLLNSYKHVHAKVLNAKLIEEVPVKPKTKEHFGDVIQGLSESKKRNIPKEYVLFFGVYNKAFSKKFAEGKLIRYNDLTEHEKKIIKLMTLYATPGDFLAYEMKAKSYLKYFTFLAFIGSEEAIRDIVEDYQRDYGSDFDFEERKALPPMKKVTKKHFGDVFAGLSESKEKDPDLYALILHLHRKDHKQDYYFIKKLEDLNELEKEILENEEGRTTSFKSGVHKFREYFPGKPTTSIDKITGGRILMYVAPKDILERELGYYKLAYGKNLVPGVQVKPETKKIFGDVLGGLYEGKIDLNLIPLNIKILKVEEDDTGWVGDVKETTYTMRLRPSTSNDTFVDIMVVEIEHKKGDEKIKYSFKDVGDHKYVGSYEDAFRLGFKWYNSDHKDIINAIKKDKTIRQLKPKTQEHFGEILRGIDESIKDPNGNEVLEISVVGYSEDEKDWQQPAIENQTAEYTIRFETNKSERYNEYHLDVAVTEYVPMKGDDRKGLQYSYRRVKEWNWGSYDSANETGWRWYRTYEKEVIGKIKKYKILKEMKPNAKKHFGDIIGGLQESNQEEEYVLVQRFKIDQNGIYKNGKYQLKPSRELTKRERIDLQKLERMHSYMDGYRGYDIDGYDEYNMIFGTKEYLEDEIEETKKYMIGGSFVEEIPMKPKTKKSFADIFDKLNESKKKEKQETWVLIIKFKNLKSSAFNKNGMKYVVCPLNELSRKNKEIYDKATNWLRPAYNRKVELSTGPDIGGVNMGDYKAEVFRGPQDIIKDELESHKRVYKMEEEIPVPMKAETEKHFGGVV